MKKINEIVKSIWAIFEGNAKTFIFIVLMQIGIMILVGIIGFISGFGVIMAQLVNSQSLESFSLSGFLAILPMVLILGIVVICVSLWTSFALYYAAEDKKRSFSECLSLAWKSFGSGLVLSFCLGFVLMLGYILLIIPGIILSVCLYFAIPVLLYEKVGILEAMKRSMALVKGYWWSVFGRVLLLSLCVYLANFVLSIFGLSIVVQILIAILWPVFTYILYKDLLSLKGGVAKES